MAAEATRTSDPAADPALLPHWLILGSVTLPGRPEHVRAARQFVTRTIGYDHPKADTAILLTSELVTNAVEHSRSRLPGGTIELAVATKSSGLLISVTDNGSDAKVPTIGVSPGRENGNGLLLVESLADVWGYLHDSASGSARTRRCCMGPIRHYSPAACRRDGRWRAASVIPSTSPCPGRYPLSRCAESPKRAASSRGVRGV